MILYPHVGHGKEKVKIIFEGCWIEPREFTVNVTPKERRGYKHDSNYFLRSIQEVTEDISNTLLEVMDFARAFQNLKVKDDDYNLILPLKTKVLNAVNAAKDGNELDQKHRLHQLQKILKE